MNEDVYRKLAEVLDTLPNGFPSTESGVELKILKKIFSPEDAELFCDLKINFETAHAISERTGRPLEGIDEHLQSMAGKGQIFAINFGGTRLYKMMPWVFGIYELQLEHLDREMCEMIEEYSETFGPQFFKGTPQLMQVIPVEKEIEGRHMALPYEQVSNIVENSKSFRVMDCICKKEQGIMDNPCDRPVQVCMSFAPVPDIFEQGDWPGKVITKQEAYDTITRAEEDGLVHLTWNMKNGHYFICNCCGCCCGVLRGINEMGVPAWNVVNSYYYAVIDPDECISCGICAEERCQVNAIEKGDDDYIVTPEKCIGCGLCISTCESEAITLVRKDEKDILTPPQDEADWFEKRGEYAGKDFSKYI